MGPGGNDVTLTIGFVEVNWVRTVVPHGRLKSSKKSRGALAMSGAVDGSSTPPKP